LDTCHLHAEGTELTREDFEVHREIVDNKRPYSLKLRRQAAAIDEHRC
jgi:endonuclease IV